jgi:hypothetical protein
MVFAYPAARQLRAQGANGEPSRFGRRKSRRYSFRHFGLDGSCFVAQSESRSHIILMKTHWFKRLGWLYVPVSVPGALVCLLAALFCLTVFRAVDRHSHSVSDTLYGVFPFFICTFLLVDWIGGRTSDRAARPEFSCRV